MSMEYKILPHGGEKLSRIGLATGGQMFSMPYEDIVEGCNYAFDHGVNIVDFISHRGWVAQAAAEAIRPRRKEIFMQTHFGIDYPNDQYTKIRDVDYVKGFIDRELKLLDTDYLDCGFIANVDTMEDLEICMAKGGLWDYMNELKDQGVMHHLGFSSHNVKMCNHLLDMGVFDLFMLSQNIAEDFQLAGNALALNADRQHLFRRCEKEGVAITTMKTFLGGKLLDARTSPFGVALTPYQCIKYNLDRPGIFSCMTGFSSLDNIKDVLGYCEASEEQKDYSIISRLTYENIQDSCIYCDHCQPCTAGLDISQINKFRDLAEIGDTDALDHYKTLSVHASDCVECGLCDERCPFHVNPSRKMKQAKEFFGY